MALSYGFTKIASAIPLVKPADCDFNVSQIEQQMSEADAAGASIVVFPELSITGYTCGDLFYQQILLNKALEGLEDIVNYSQQFEVAAIVGLPIRVQNSIYNCAAVVHQGRVVAVVGKHHLPNYNEFYEQRWFASIDNCKVKSIDIAGCMAVPFGGNLIINSTDFNFAIEICEDLWTPCPPSSLFAVSGAEVIFNLSASNELICKNSYLRTLIAQQSARTISAYIYSSAGFGESTTDVVYAGNAIIAENGTIISSSERFQLTPQVVYADIDLDRLRADRQKNSTFKKGQPDWCNIEYEHIECNICSREFEFTRTFNPTPFVPSENEMVTRCEEIFNIQIHGLATRLHHIGGKTMVIGMSGGLDSTLAMLVCVKTCDLLGIDRSNIIGVTMPGFGTTNRTYTNAVELTRRLGATLKEISIKDACIQHFKDIEHDVEVHDVTYENTQARERTQILMDLANKYNGIVVGTGDLSELALGWATYNGDHMSMYGVNAGIPKTLIRYLVRYASEYQVEESVRENLIDVIDTPVSPELLPANADGTIKQRTEETVGPYELHDFCLYYTLRFGYTPSKIRFLAEKTFAEKLDAATIDKWLKIFYRRFFNQQFKRSCLPDGPKVGSVCLSPRGDWRMPSDASSRAWLNDLE